MKRRLFIGLLLAGLGVAAWLGWSGMAVKSLTGPTPVADANGYSAFEQWLAADPARAPQFAALEALLAREGVAGVVPAWQLLRIDADYARRCGSERFAMPPARLWPNIIPALRLVRDDVIPEVGAVAVHSAWRSPAINSCVHGASRSRHLDFRAVDLVTATPARDADLFRQLCALHRRAGIASGMGLGAYYRTDNPETSQGRFHIDTAGFRDWGFDYTSASSPCQALLTQDQGE